MFDIMKHRLNGYGFAMFSDDFIAALIVTVLLVPQALAYAVLAGLPPQTGIYASIFPLIAYALCGSSRHLAVGPTALVSLLTAVGIASLPSELRLIGAATLALMSGMLLMGFGLMRAGTIINFVSRPVLSAYVSGAAVLIIFSQLQHLFGVETRGNTVSQLGQALLENIPGINVWSLWIGVATLIFLMLIKRYLAFMLFRLGAGRKQARLSARLAPIVIVLAGLGLSLSLSLSEQFDVAVVGVIPAGLPDFLPPRTSFEILTHFIKIILPMAAIIALMSFIDCMSISQTLAARSRQHIDPNREMLSLGLSNIVAGLSHAYPVAGSLSRSAVKMSAGGKTTLAGLLTALFMGFIALFFTPYMAALPLAILAAFIISACLNMVDTKTLWQTWRYSRVDGLTALACFLTVLFLGVIWGMIVGVVLAMALHIRTTLHPHLALVGRFPGTEHYRDATKFNVETSEIVKTLRIDESLYYANARYLEDKIAHIVAESPQLKHLILMCPAVNRIDASAIHSLLTINARLQSAGICLHFSELHSHIRERLEQTRLRDKLTGQIFFSQHEAMGALEPEPDWSQLSDHIDIH